MARHPDGSPKLPINQLAILAVARFAEPLALSSVFPYLPEMIKGFGVAKNDVAYWAGVTSALFSFSQSLTAVPWGRASDRFGRKPTIIIGLISTMICFLFWGLATSLPMAIIARMIQGGGNGNVGIIRTMVAEMVPEKELQPRAFSLMPLVWSLGSIFGPAFGGFFAKPAERFPSLFGGVAFFEKFPFALPNLIAAAFFMISVTTATLFLRETIAHKRHHEDWGILMGKRLTRPFKRRSLRTRTRRRSFVDAEATAPLIPTKINRNKSKPHARAIQPSMKEVFTPQSSTALLAYTFLALHSVAWDQILPVFLNYPEVEHTPENTQLPFKFIGGFGMESGKIGTLFTVYGIACGFIQFIIFPPICTKLGALKCFKTCCMAFPIVYLLTPYTVLVENPTGRLAFLLAVMLFKAFCVIFAFPSLTILLTNSCSSLRILGTLNGFATTFSALGRGIGPAMAGASFSWGVKKGYVSVAWWFLFLTAVLGAIPAAYMIDGPGPSQDVDSGDDDEGTEDEEVNLVDSAIMVGDESDVGSDEEDQDPYVDDEDGETPTDPRHRETYGATPR